MDIEHTYGCLFSLGRRALLFDAETPLLLAGRFVAYEQVSYDPDGSVYYLLTVFDLRRRAASSFSSLYEDQPPTHLSRESQDPGMATDLVLWAALLEAARIEDHVAARARDPHREPQVDATAGSAANRYSLISARPATSCTSSSSSGTVISGSPRSSRARRAI